MEALVQVTEEVKVYINKTGNWVEEGRRISDDQVEGAQIFMRKSKILKAFTVQEMKYRENLWFGQGHRRSLGHSWEMSVFQFLGKDLPWCELSGSPWKAACITEITYGHGA